LKRLLEGGGEGGGKGGGEGELYFLLLGKELLQARYSRPAKREGEKEEERKEERRERERERERKRRRSRSWSRSRSPSRGGSRSRSDSHGRREERQEGYMRKEDEDEAEEEEERRLRSYCAGKYWDDYLAHGHPVPYQFVRREGGREEGRKLSICVGETSTPCCAVQLTLLSSLPPFFPSTGPQHLQLPLFLL